MKCDSGKTSARLSRQFNGGMKAKALLTQCRNVPEHWTFVQVLKN